MNQNYNFVQGLFSQVMNGKNEKLATKKTTTFKGFLLMIVFALFANFSSQGQTVLLSSAGDGGFESGATFAANNWTVVNSSTDSWYLGSAPVVSTGARCAYITSTPTTTATWSYSQLSVIQHMYYDVTIPAGQPIVTMTFKWKAQGEGSGTSDWDNLKIFWGTVTNIGVPVANTALASTYQVSGPGATSGMYKLNSAAYNSETISFSGTPGTTYRLVLSWKSDGSTIANPPAAVDDINLVSAPISTFTATANGGLWSSPATWVGGVVPGAGNDIVIPAGTIVTVDQVTSYRNLDVNGILQWNGTANAMTISGNLNVNSGARFLPYSSVATPVGVTVNIGGNFQNNGYANLAVASTLINFNGSGSTLSGTGVFEGDGTRGIIRSLYFQNLGSNSVSTTQNLTVTNAFAVTAGSLNTNGKIRIDNTAQIYGQALNLQVASLAVTNMGSLYTVAPVVFGQAVVPYANALAAVLGTRYFNGNNVYLCTAAGTFNATPPTSTAATTFTTSGPTLIWIGTLGTLGTNVPYNGTLSLTTQYFYGDNVYQAIATTATTTMPVHTSGTVGSFRYLGTVAKASVNFDSVTGTVRSLNLTQMGSGFSTAPAVAISKGLGDTTGTGAVAIAVLFQQIAGPANSTTQKSGVASITGGLTINSDQGASVASSDVQASSGVGAISTANGGLNYTVAPLVGFAGPPTLNLVTNPGSGYTAAPTITVTGGTLVSGTALASSNFTITMNQGKVVSVYLNTATTATYSVPPTLSFSTGNATLAFPTGCWPAATANLGSNGQITSFTMTNAGFGYAAAPTVGVGTTSATTAGGTFTTVATAPTARIALYNLTLNWFAPAVAAVVATDDATIPANRKMNNLSLAGTGGMGLNLNNNLVLFGTSPLTLTASASTTGNVLNLGGNNLLFTWNGYAGASSTYGTSSAYIKNGSMTLTGRGGGTTGSTFNYPFSGTVSVFTGGGTSTAVTQGTDALTVKVTEVGAPGNSVAGGSGIALGNRAFKVETASTLGTATSSSTLFGGSPQTVKLSYVDQDGLTTTQPQTYVLESTSLNGAWNLRSAAIGTTGALTATGNLTTATIAPGPITLANGNFYSWGTGAPTIAGVIPTVLCANSGAFSISGTNFLGVTAVKIGGTPVLSFTVVNDTTITGFAGPGTTGTISVTKFGLTVTGIENITVSPSPSAPTVSASSVNINLGGTVTVTASGGSGTFRWYNDAYAGTLLYTGPTFSAPLCSGNLWVAEYNGSCEGLRTMVTVTIAPTAIVSSVNTFCGVGAPVTLTASPADATITYTWSSLTPSTTISTTVGASTLTSSLSETSDFSLVATNGTCTATVYKSIGVYPLPTATVTTTAQGVCPGTSATIGSGLSAGNFTVTCIPAPAAAAIPPVGAVALVGGNALITPLPAGVSVNSTTNLDDNFWSGIPVGFNFNFFGNIVTNVFIGTNGTINLGTAGSTQYNFTGGFPNSANPASTVAVSARDLRWDSAGAGKITYWTEGIAPNRRFIVQFLNAKPYSYTTGNQTAEAVFYETLGTIDIRVFEATNGTGTTSGTSTSKYIGLQDATRTIGATAPNCSTTPVTANYWNGTIDEILATAPKAWRFAPPSNYNTTWYANGVVMPSVTANPTATPPVVGYTNPGSNVFSIPVAPASTTTYSISYTNQTTGCTNAAGSAQVVMAVLGNTIPAGLTTNASATSICFGDTVNLSTSYTGITDGMVFQWQNSTDGGTTWTDIASATALTYSTSPTVPSSYRCKMIACNGVPGYTSPASIGFSNTVVSTTPGLRCGTGTATISATGSAGTSINWYTSATGGATVGTGSSYVTPSITATTTYYAEAVGGYSSGFAGAPGPATSTNGTNVGSHGIMITTTVPNVNIISADIPFTGTGTLTIALKDATNTTEIASVTTGTVTGNGLTTVTVPLNLIVAAPGNYTLIVTAVSGTVGALGYSSATFPYSALGGGFTVTSGYWYGADTTTNMYLHNINVSKGCASPRVPVVVTVTTPPTITLSGNPATICSESNTAPVTVTAGGSNYDSYVWTPTSVTGNATNGWVFNPLRTTTYTLAASQTTGATPCATSASITVNVNPTPSVITVDPATASACANLILPMVATGGTISPNYISSMDVLPSDFTVNNPNASTVTVNNTYFSEGTGSILFNVSAVSANAKYSMNTDLDMTGSTSATLTFSHIAAMEGSFTAYDYGYVEYSLDGGTTWINFTPSDYVGSADLTVFNANARFSTKSYADWISQFTGSTSDPGVGPATSLWKSETFNIPTSALTSTQFRIRFRYTTDISTNYYGWLIDNVRINKSAPTTMVWAPTTNLYTDAAATIPYNGENLTTVYFKSAVAASTVNYTATASSSLGCSRVATVPVTVYQTAAPTGTQFYQFCPTGGATVTSMTSVVTGANIKWYSTSTGGTALAPTTPLTQGYYWASQTLNGCESPTRFLVFAISNATAAPSSSTSQQFCNSATVANLTANGTGLQWYTAATGGTALTSTTALATGTYYVSQTSGGCESPRTAVSVTVNVVPAPTGAATQSLSSLLTLGDIVVTGSNIVWYASAADAASGTNPLPATQLLANTTYYATQTINGCRSATSLAVTITTLANQDFDLTQFTYYPNPVIDLLNIKYSQEMTSVKVFNMVGQQLLNKQVNSDTVQVDMSNYANGAYFIQVTTENAMKTVRVIKK